jgi:hypothetical protein
MSKGWIFVCLVACLCGGSPLFGKTIVIRGGEIHPMNGKTIVSGTILIRDGRIVEIGEDVRVPEDAEVFEARGYILYPGLVAPAGIFTPAELETFESFTPDTSALDRFDFRGDYSRWLRGGVTSAFVAMPGDRFISGKGAVVKLGRGEKLSTVLKREAALTVNLGKEAVLPPMTDIFPAPVSAGNPLVPSMKQYPSSSLGAFWLLNELFRFDPYSGDLAAYLQNVSDSLRKAHDLGLPLIVHCHKAADIYQAVDLAKRVKLPLIIHGAGEAGGMIDLLKENGASVIAEVDVRPDGQWPDEDSEKEEQLRNRLKAIPALIREGILTAVTPAEDRYLSDLFWVVQYFQKYGLDQEELIKTVTVNPAKIFGLEERIGSLARGCDADILFFKKEPGKPLPRLKKVMSEGHIVYEEK